MRKRDSCGANATFTDDRCCNPRVIRSRTTSVSDCGFSTRYFRPLACGCASYTERQSLGYGDYAAFTCDQLGREAVGLTRETRSRSEHLLGNNQNRRDAAMSQPKATSPETYSLRAVICEPKAHKLVASSLTFWMGRRPGIRLWS